MIRPREFMTSFGALRVLLVVGVVGLIVAAPFSDGPIHSSGHASVWPLALGVIAPTLFVIMVFVLPLDITMTLVFMSRSAGRGAAPAPAHRANRNRAAGRDDRRVDAAGDAAAEHPGLMRAARA